jgi:hypothetical protein
MTIADDRLIGTDEILPVMKETLSNWDLARSSDIHQEAGHSDDKNRLPSTRRKAVIFIHDLIAHELKNGRTITVNDILMK